MTAARNEDPSPAGQEDPEDQRFRHTVDNRAKDNPESAALRTTGTDSTVNGVVSSNENARADK